MGVKDNHSLAMVALMIHVHQASNWALVLKDRVTGEMKFRLNGGLGHFNKLCNDLEKNADESLNDLYDRGNTIDRLLSLSMDDPKKYNEIIDLIQMHLNNELTILDQKP